MPNRPLRPFPILGQPVIRLWLVLHDDTSMHLDGCCPSSPSQAFPLSDLADSPFASRFRPTLTRRTPREGAVSRSPGRPGLVRYRPPFFLRYHCPAWICSYENQSIFAAHPLLIKAVSSEQIAHNGLQATGRGSVSLSESLLHRPAPEPHVGRLIRAHQSQKGDKL